MQPLAKHSTSIGQDQRVFFYNKLLCFTLTNLGKFVIQKSYTLENSQFVKLKYMNEYVTLLTLQERNCSNKRL